MKFQGQWVSVDISGSFFPKVVCTSEVKTCPRSSCHGPERKAPACSALSSGMAPYSSTACSLHTPPQPRFSTTTLPRCFAREMSQQPPRRGKECRQGGTPNTAVPKTPLALKSVWGTGQLCSAPPFFPLLKDRPCQDSQL